MNVFAGTDELLIALSGVIATLFLVAIAFSCYAILLRWGHARRERLWTALSHRWEQPVLSAIVDPGQVEAVRATVPNEYRLHFVQFVLEYTRRVRGQERGTLRRLVEPYLPEIAERTGHRDAGVRMRAVQTLGTLGLPKYAEAVTAGLDDPSPVVAMVAARYLAREEYPELAPDVLDHLDKFHGWNRRFLASMLSAIGPDVSGGLRERLASPETDDWIRAVCAEALQMQRDPLAGDVAAEVLDAEPGRELRAATLRLLADVGRPDHVPVVRRLCRSEDEVVRAQALHALGSLSDGSDVPELFEAMRDDSPWAALHAARGVREAGGRVLLEDIADSDHELAELAGQVLFEEGEE